MGGGGYVHTSSTCGFNMISIKFNYPEEVEKNCRMWEKLWQNLFCRNRFNLHDGKPPLFQQYFFKPMKVLIKENKASHVKYDFRVFFSKCVYMPDINFSKCVVTALSFPKSRYLRISENTLTKFKKNLLLPNYLANFN